MVLSLSTSSSLQKNQEVTDRIRGRLEEEDFDQVPQLATSLLIELKCLGGKRHVSVFLWEKCGVWLGYSKNYGACSQESRLGIPVIRL